MNGEEILSGLLETDLQLHNVLRKLVNTEQIPQVYTRPLSKILKRYLQDAANAKDYSQNIDRRLVNLIQRGNEICDVIKSMIEAHHLNDDQLEMFKAPLVDRGKYAVAYSERRKNGVVLFDGAGRQVN